MRKISPFLLLLLLLPLLAACDRGPHLKPLPDHAVILAFGDSLTYGTGAEEGESYPDVLERILGRKVVNAGVPGEASAQGIERLPGVLAEVEPNLVILLHGGNDMLRRLDAKQLEANLREMVAISLEAGAEVLLIGVPAPAIFMQTASLYNRVAADMNVLIDRHSLPDILSRKEMRSEDIHPNADGYAALAEAIAETIRKSIR
jgi:acyl-CoA thioesterase I